MGKTGRKYKISQIVLKYYLILVLYINVHQNGICKVVIANNTRDTWEKIGRKYKI